MIAVTGAGGFIGTALCRALVGAGAPVREVRRPGAPPPVEGLERAEISDLDRGALARAFVGADVVVHLAGRAHRLREDRGDPLAAFRQVNVEGTRAVVEAAADAGVRRVLVASSVKAVGESTPVPWTESTPPAPVDPYGVSKLESERAAFAAGAGRGVETVVMRFPLVYGPGAPANVLRLVALVNRGLPLPFAGIDNRRSMLSTGNLVAAVRALAGTHGLDGEVFFVADGVDLSTPELIRTIAAGLGRRARLFRISPQLFRAGGKIGDGISRVVRCPVTSAEVERLTGSLVVSIAKLVEWTGFRPPETPEAGWRAVARWFLERSR
jgi:nucleoside-diphosphate-sugar epimerase